MAATEWFLLKANDKEVYGPVTLGELKLWAVAAKISPMDRISNDNRASWSRAPMIPDLQMDWLIELEDDHLYGPTCIATIEEFIKSGEISGATILVNCLENKRIAVEDCPAFTNILANQENQEEESSAKKIKEVKSLKKPLFSGRKVEERLLLLENNIAQLRNEVGGLREALRDLKSHISR